MSVDGVDISRHESDGHGCTCDTPVVEIGRARWVVKTAVRAAPNSMEKPREDE